MNIGDIILYRRKRQIHSWTVTEISRSGLYIEVVNDDWNEHWIHISDVLEIIESEEDNFLTYPSDDGEYPAAETISARPPQFSTKDYVRAGPPKDRFRPNEI